MGVNDSMPPMHQTYEEDGFPVTHRECYLRRQVIETRIGSQESDIREIKIGQQNIMDKMEKYFDDQDARWKYLYLMVIVILILVAAGRLFDVDTWLGLLT